MVGYSGEVSLDVGSYGGNVHFAHGTYSTIQIRIYSLGRHDPTVIKNRKSIVDFVRNYEYFHECPASTFLLALPHRGQ